LAEKMSAYAAHIRYIEDIRKVKDEAKTQLQILAKQTIIHNPSDLVMAFENMDLLIAQYVYAAAMEDYIAVGGGSRGSYIIQTSPPAPLQKRGEKDPPSEGAGGDDTVFKEMLSPSGFLMDDGKFSGKIQEVRFSLQGCDFTWEQVRPIPEHDDWFENVWREFREE